MTENEMEWEDRMGRLEKAATALYEAGHWSCDRPVDEAKLWEDLRDALNREPEVRLRRLKANDPR